jgi:O-antigen ligase
VLAFGSVYPWAYWPLGIASSVLGVWAIAASRAWQDPRMVRLGLVLSFLIAAIVVQLFPLPYDWAVWLSPGLDTFLRQFQLGYRAPDRHALSLEPGRTAVVLFLAVSLSLLLVGVTRMVRRVPLEWLVSQLMGLAVGLSVVGVVFRAFFDPTNPLVFGFWRPRSGGNPFGPFVNRNHFAGWMVMVLPVVAMYGVAVLMQAQGPIRHGLAARLRWLATVDGNRVLLVAVATVVMSAALVLTGSRSGVASLVVAATAVLVFVLKRTPGRRHRLVAVMVTGLALGSAVAWAGSDIVVARFSTASGAFGERLEAWRDTVAIARDFPMFGVGLGSYGRAMLVYQTGERQLMYVQAHNDYLQIAAEGGALIVIPAVLILLTLVSTIRHRLRSADDDAMTYWIRRGAVAGLLGIAAQSVMEFSLQMPGNAVLFVILLAIALHRPRSVHHAHRV